MNKCFLCGRLTRNPEVKYNNDKAIARFTLAVDRKYKRDGEPEADFFNCTAFGKTAEVVEKYVTKGTKLLITGRIQNDNYTNKDGQTVYSVQILVDELEFAESKNNRGNDEKAEETANDAFNGGFMGIPNGIDDDELPFE